MFEAYLEENLKRGMSGDSFGPGKMTRFAYLKVGYTLVYAMKLSLKLYIRRSDAEKMFAGGYPRVRSLLERLFEERFFSRAKEFFP